MCGVDFNSLITYYRVWMCGVDLIVCITCYRVWMCGVDLIVLLHVTECGCVEWI